MALCSNPDNPDNKRKTTTTKKNKEKVFSHDSLFQPYIYNLVQVEATRILHKIENNQNAVQEKNDLVNCGNSQVGE